MPLYPTSFFIPPAGVPFIVEDKYVRGGYRAAANAAERDAIAVAGRKQGMLVRTMDDNVIWELVGGTGNTFWKIFDATKYIKLGAPLVLNTETGTIVLDLGDMFEVDGNGKLVIDVTNLLGPTFKDFFAADADDNGKVISYDHTSQSFILRTVTSGSSYTAKDPIEIVTGEIQLNMTKLFGASMVGFFSAAAGDDGKALVYDHAQTKFVLKAVASSNTRASLNQNVGSLAAGASSNFVWATGKAAMLLTLTVNVPDVTVECHTTPDRNDANPYRFKSAAGKLSDDGISVLEDSSLQYNRRFAFVVNLEGTPGTNTFWKVTNNSASSQSITVNSTYLRLE